MKDVQELISRAIDALDAEIETVREKPSSDVLFSGKRMGKGGSSAADYQFESHQPAIRFAEEITARFAEKELLIHPIAYEKKQVTLRFPEDQGAVIEKVEVEWENDFILKRTRQELVRLLDQKKPVLQRLERLFNPNGEAVPFTGSIADDGQRNPPQREAIEKSQTGRTLFVWGPPGTGKTATLGYIIANYLKRNKTVLFASNTNRAVDVGLLSVVHALRETGQPVEATAITRFGDAALEQPELEPLLFDRQIDTIVQQRREKAGEWISLLQQREEVLKRVKKRLQEGKKSSSKLDLELALVDQQIQDKGGIEVLQERIDELSTVHERHELHKRRLIATTLAKVCTSDLFRGLEFDAVVVDEGSMANLPYLMVLASLCKWHMVVVGDPMQLPPIALTSDPEKRAFLEADIFTTVSDAESGDALFRWHDENPAFTSFFDTQYRLEASLADIISTVFYEGRLQTGKRLEEPLQPGQERAFHLVDTSKYNPVLEQKSGERGFQPVNLVHQEVIERLIGNMQQKGVFLEEVGVIVPFRSAVYDVRNRLYSAGFSQVEVGTIHTFQGREKEYIVFDTVMSGERQRGTIRHYTVRPLDEDKNGLSVPRLLNVAFSRSRKQLIVLADMNHVERVYGGKFLHRLLEKIGGGR